MTPIGILTHDVNNLLSIIRQYNNIIKHCIDINDTNPVPTYLTRIQDAADAIKAIHDKFYTDHIDKFKLPENASL